jgi:tripartite-type tricarboxylate transporter receptor subunit TctC
MKKPSLVATAVAMLAAAFAGPFAFAQAPSANPAYPAKTVTFVVPYAAGGFSDIRARKIGEKLAKALGVTVIIDNKAGAGGVIGTNVVAKAPPDGSTIGMGNFAPLSVNVSLMSKLPYDPLTDIVPIVMVEKSPLILTVSPSQGITSVKDIIARAKAKPGAINYGSSGIGGAHHLSGAMFGHQAGIDIIHVPYKGGGNAATDLLAGHISMMFEMGYAALPSVEAGKIKALAVTSAKRLPLLPNVPTVAESGLPGFESYNWQGIIAPKGTPPEIVARLSRELNEILKMPDIRDGITAQASEPAGGTPEEFAAFIRSETAKWAAVIKTAGIKPE